MNTDSVTIYARRGSETVTVQIPVADLGPVTYAETVPPEPYTVETHDEVLRRSRLAFNRFNARRRRFEHGIEEHTRSCLADCAPST